MIFVFMNLVKKEAPKEEKPVEEEVDMGGLFDF